MMDHEISTTAGNILPVVTWQESGGRSIAYCRHAAIGAVEKARFGSRWFWWSRVHSAGDAHSNVAETEADARREVELCFQSFLTAAGLEVRP